MVQRFQIPTMERAGSQTSRWNGGQRARRIETVPTKIPSYQVSVRYNYFNTSFSNNIMFLLWYLLILSSNSCSLNPSSQSRNLLPISCWTCVRDMSLQLNSASGGRMNSHFLFPLLYLLAAARSRSTPVRTMLDMSALSGK